MIDLRIIADRSKANARLRRYRADFEKTGKKTVEELGKIGKQFARTIAPYDSGATFRNIVLRKGNSDHEAVVMAQNPTRGDGHKRNIANFNLVRWMHTSPRAAAHIYSGDEHFMYTTREYLRRIGGKAVTGRYRRVIIRNK